MMALALPFWNPRSTPAPEAAAHRRALYEATHRLAWAALYKLVGPSGELEDLMQETWLQVLESEGRFRGASRETTWVYGIAVNVALMHLRKRRRTLPQVPAEAVPQPDDALARAQAAVLARRALALMSPERAEIFAACELLERPPAEVAAELGLEYNTVRSRLARARVEFAERVAQLQAPVPKGAP